MSKTQIIENNKLIARFMGLTYFPKGNEEGKLSGWWYLDTTKYPDLLAYLKHKPHKNKLDRTHRVCRHHHELRYSNSWDELMRVVDKIENITLPLTDHKYKNDVFTVKIFERICSIKSYIYSSTTVFTKQNQITGRPGKFDAVYQEVVKFIKWYNDNTRNS